MQLAGMHIFFLEMTKNYVLKNKYICIRLRHCQLLSRSMIVLFSRLIAKLGVVQMRRLIHHSSLTPLTMTDTRFLGRGN